jgi:hypothetical protein
MVMTEQQLGQRRNALGKANRVRSDRAEIKRQLVEGEITFDALLAHPPDAIVHATIGEVLLWAPGIGKWRKQRILGQVAIPHTVKIESLSERSKARLAESYEEWVPYRTVRTPVAA